MASPRRSARDIVRLHPETVTNVEQHVRRRPRAAETRSRSGRVEVSVIDPRVWQQALKLAGGDASRIEIVSLTEVVIR